MPLEEASVIGEVPALGAINIHGLVTLGIMGIGAVIAWKVGTALAKKI